MNILYLCNKHQFDTKMSRVRFHGIAALAKITDVTYSGIGWDNYKDSLTVNENIHRIYGQNRQPEWIIAYKPLELMGFKESSPKKCIRYNEMWDIRGTRSEIINSGANLVVCHHLNDMPNYRDIAGVKFVNISHCAEKSIYKDYGLPKNCDVLLTGAISSHYPFRARLRSIMLRLLASKVRCRILEHPGGDLNQVHGLILEDYAKAINAAKITLTCSSRHKYRLGKYTEIPICASVLGGDLPNEDQDFFKKFMLVLNTGDSDETIANKVIDLLNDDDRYNSLVQTGLQLNREYTQEDYAKRLLQQLMDYEGICK